MFNRKFIFTSKKWAGGEENVQNGMGKADSVLGSLILNRKGKLWTRKMSLGFQTIDVCSEAVV